MNGEILHFDKGDTLHVLHVDGGHHVQEVGKAVENVNGVKRRPIVAASSSECGATRTF